MSNDMYAKIQNKIDRGISDSTWTSLEEARLARENGEVDNEGIPLIAVIADGAWYSSNGKYVSKPIRDLLHGSIKRLRAAVENATKYRRTNSVSVMSACADLKTDLLNGPSHVFGEHKKCMEIGYFCTRQKGQEEHVKPRLQECGLYRDIMSHVNRLIHNAKSLILNKKNNAAESYNSIVAKFVGEDAHMMMDDTGVPECFHQHKTQFHVVRRVEWIMLDYLPCILNWALYHMQEALGRISSVDTEATVWRELNTKEIATPLSSLRLSGRNSEMAICEPSSVSVVVSSDDGLPETLCARCFKELNIAYNFKKRCEQSDEYFRQYLTSKHGIENSKTSPDNEKSECEFSNEDTSNCSSKSEISSSVCDISRELILQPYQSQIPLHRYGPNEGFKGCGVVSAEHIKGGPNVGKKNQIVFRSSGVMAPGVLVHSVPVCTSRMPD
ncbi:hypothetical protein CBL_10514 [Carabus blaptoides fortunei]